ncbi:hypothetical protein glysoja_046819 [Glycine soja]|uniref:CCHC-type domain-containing protein n=1 Tax=Glycine soja TaxID=3848 RepID=A0A0B2QVC7_GLYSO|nr:hypothetical protein glysoja_046819 [Glycine soja]
MANSSSSLLTLANNNTSNLSLQHPPITIKLDRDNYSRWRSTIISALETFELESFILSLAPPSETRITTTFDGVSIPEPNPDFLLWKKKNCLVLLWIKFLAENLHPISDEDLVGYLLSGLDSSYGPFSIAFMMKDAYASVDDLTGLLLQEEARLEQDHARHATPVTLPSQLPPLLPTPTTYTATHCSTRPSPNNTHSNNSSSFQNRSYDNRHRRPTCQICNKPGHEAIDC